MARKKLAYFPLYPSDFDTDENVRGMDDAELGFYLRCLNHAWVNGSIPADLDELARIFRRPLKYVEKLWARVGRCFTQAEGHPDRLVNPRQEEERGAVQRKSDVARSNVRKRWNGSPGRYGGNTTVSVQYPPGNTHQNQNHTTTPVTPCVTPGLKEAFDRLAERYPNCTDVDYALQVWMGYCEAGIVTPENVHEVEDGLARYLESDLWARENGRYIVSFGRWLHGKKWLDRPKPSAESMAAVRSTRRSSDGNDAHAEWIPPWK